MKERAHPAKLPSDVHANEHVCLCTHSKQVNTRQEKKSQAGEIGVEVKPLTWKASERVWKRELLLPSQIAQHRLVCRGET